MNLEIWSQISTVCFMIFLYLLKKGVYEMKILEDERTEYIIDDNDKFRKVNVLVDLGDGQFVVENDKCKRVVSESRFKDRDIAEETISLEKRLIDLEDEKNLITERLWKISTL